MGEWTPVFKKADKEAKSINQSIYLRQYVGWGCPGHPSQRLMYKTHDNQNTNLIKIQYI